MELIKTRYKEKPNKGLTHSLGAKGISEGLSGCNNYSALQIGFHNEKGKRIGVYAPGWSLKKIKGKSSDLLSFRCIISINFSETLDKWHFSLYPIEVNQSKTVKIFLIEEGLPIVKTWLNLKRTETWFSGHRYLQIGLNENLDKYCIFETWNDRIIEKKIQKLKTPINA